YLEEKWIEPIPPLKAPFSLLYHQTMSILASMGELSPQALAQKVLTLKPFNNVTQEDFKELLRHLLTIKHIERMENGGLIVGLEGEKVVRNYRFYAVFQDVDEWTVKEKTSDGTKEIGKLGTLMMPGERFPLAGYVWEVIEAFPEQKTMLVKKIGGKMRYVWPGGIGDVHTKILQRMRKLLFEENWKYSYLQKGAIFRLEQARKLAKDLELDKQVLFQLSDTRYCLFPWMGTTAFRTLERIIRFIGGQNLNITKVTGFSPYYLQFDTDPKNIDDLQEILKRLCDQVESPYQLMAPNEKFIWRKYDEYLPVTLQKKAFANDYLSIDEIKVIIEDWDT
ncbi:MAG: ATP-dependent helicase, partial [Candidatus Hermodarchaeota archaeon]